RSKDYKNEDNITKPWTNLQTISNQDTIEIELTASNVPCGKTYIFVWLRDAFGNSVTYVLTAPQFESNNKWKTWWTADTEGPAATFSYQVKNNYYQDLTLNTDYSVEDSGNTITMRYKKNAKTLIFSVTATDNKSGLKILKFDTDSNFKDYPTKQLDNLSSSRTTSHTITATDEIGNTSTWTLNLIPVTSLNSSINHVSDFTSVIGTTRDTNTDSTSSSQLSQSFSTFAPISNFADTVTNFVPATNKKSLRRAKRSSKNVAEVAAVEEIKQIAQTVEPVIERAELVQNDTVTIEPAESITPVESFVQPVNKIIDSLPAADNKEKLADEEALELPQVNAQISEPVVQSQLAQVESQKSNYDDAELKLFDRRSLYAAIAVLLVALSALGGIFITRAKKMKK
ncbi:MAG: hypothetical protein K6G09_12285, partial [Treponema sp.]|nr:hypothetical protein [Treponema sp.]